MLLKFEPILCRLSEKVFEADVAPTDIANKVHFWRYLQWPTITGERPTNWPTHPHLPHQNLMLTLQKISQFTVVSGLGPTSQKETDTKWQALCVLYIGLFPCPVTVTTRIIIFLVGDPYKPSFATVTGRGTTQIYIRYYQISLDRWISDSVAHSECLYACNNISKSFGHKNALEMGIWKN